MNALVEPKNLKGFRDFSASDLAKRNYLKQKIIQVFEHWGFEPLETPTLEHLDIFSGNIGEDEKLFYHFIDHGGRAIALRYDQTVPSCRYVAQNKNNLVFPYKRYQIQNVFRAENPQKGRYREFLQCDADIFGAAGYEADAEVIALGLDIYKTLGFKKYLVKINDRQLLKDFPYPVLSSIDKLAKIGREKVKEELIQKNYSANDADTFLNKIYTLKPNDAIAQIFTFLKALGFAEDSYRFDPSIIRSFSYSSGPVWEIVIPELGGSSVLGGERYDNLISRFQKDSLPATGFGLGFDRTLEAMEELKLLPRFTQPTKILITVFSPALLSESLKIAKALRDKQINCEVYPASNEKLDKQLKYASRKNIPYVVILGEEEIKKQTITLKNLFTHEQESVSLDKLLNLLKR